MLIVRANQLVWTGLGSKGLRSILTYGNDCPNIGNQLKFWSVGFEDFPWLSSVNWFSFINTTRRKQFHTLRLKVWSYYLSWVSPIWHWPLDLSYPIAYFSSPSGPHHQTLFSLFNIFFSVQNLQWGLIHIKFYCPTRFLFLFSGEIIIFYLTKQIFL